MAEKNIGNQNVKKEKARDYNITGPKTNIVSFYFAGCTNLSSAELEIAVLSNLNLPLSAEINIVDSATSKTLP